MRYEIPRESSLVNNYMKVSKNRIFKILPLLEEGNDGLTHYLKSLLFELYGLQHAIIGIEKSSSYLSLLSTLESILDEIIFTVKDFEFIRSEIFKAINLVEKIQKGE